MASSGPQGKHPRRDISRDDRKAIESSADRLLAVGALSGKARDYLVYWGLGTLRRCPRPERYSFLEHSCDGYEFRVDRRVALEPRHDVRRVQVLGLGGAALPADEEPADDDGVLVMGW